MKKKIATPPAPDFQMRTKSGYRTASKWKILQHKCSSVEGQKYNQEEGRVLISVDDYDAKPDYCVQLDMSDKVAIKLFHTLAYALTDKLKKEDV